MIAHDRAICPGDLPNDDKVIEDVKKYDGGNRSDVKMLVDCGGELAPPATFVDVGVNPVAKP